MSLLEAASLSAAQRIDVVLKSEELLGTLTAVARSNSLRNLKQNNSPTVSMESLGKKGKTSEKIAEIARTSRVQVDRLRRVKREAPDKYAEVVDGKKSIRKAYDELPPTRKNKKGKDTGKSKAQLSPALLAQCQTIHKTYKNYR